MNSRNTYAVLPCNGMDKAAGAVTRQIALDLSAQTGSEIICPVLYRVADARYSRIAQEHPLLVLDGCGTRCASKLAAEKGLKVAKKLTVTEEAKKNAIPLADSLRGAELAASLRLDEAGLSLAKTIVADLLKAEGPESAGQEPPMAAPAQLEYETYQKDKFIFRLPKTGFFFSENDFWVLVSGNRARVGMTDFLQQSLSDIAFFNPPAIGAAIEQFGELGTIESAKAVLEVVSPVAGKVVAVNEALATSPELINQSPYEQGWLVELEMDDLETDRELLLDFAGYFPIMKRKVDEFQVK
jgi:glycine cleavage system H protein